MSFFVRSSEKYDPAAPPKSPPAAPPLMRLPVHQIEPIDAPELAPWSAPTHGLLPFTLQLVVTELVLVVLQRELLPLVTGIRVHVTKRSWSLHRLNLIHH